MKESFLLGSPAASSRPGQCVDMERLHHVYQEEHIYQKRPHGDQVTTLAEGAGSHALGPSAVAFDCTFQARGVHMISEAVLEFGTR